jgi:putative heme-binding domain-containing protein
VNGPPPVKSVEWAGTRPVLAAVRAALRADQPAVVRAALAGVRTTRDPEAAAVVRDLHRRAADQGVVRDALAALGALKDAEAGKLVRAVLDDSGRPWLVPTAIDTAAQVGGAEAAAGLRAFVSSAPRDAALLTRAVAALGAVKDAEAVGLLATTTATADGEVRRAAAAALARIGGQPARDALVGLAGNPTPAVRRDAVTALGELTGPSAVPTLLTAYADPETRPAALRALAKVPDARAADAYLDGLGESDGQVREECRRAVQAIRKEVRPRAEARADTLPPAALTLLRQVYADDPAAKSGKLFAATVASADDYLAFARDTAGDPARGANLFADARLGCAKCHKVNGQGGEIGPDLSTIGAQFDRGQLAEAVVYPSRAIREGYHQVTVTTVDGRVVAGLVRAEAADSITLRDADGKDHTLKADDIEKRSAVRASLMPEGLHAGITKREFADLVTYLHSLRPRK